MFTTSIVVNIIKILLKPELWTNFNLKKNYMKKNQHVGIQMLFFWDCQVKKLFNFLIKIGKYITYSQNNTTLIL